VTPISQQNPPGPLKLLGLREKTGKNTDFFFDFAKKDRFFSRTFCNLVAATKFSIIAARPPITAARSRASSPCDGYTIFGPPLLICRIGEF
jgi:hypothetical protein